MSSASEAARLARSLRQRLGVLKSWGLEALPVKRASSLRKHPPFAPGSTTTVMSAGQAGGLQASGKDARSPGRADSASPSVAEALAGIAKEIERCTRCPLHKTRTRPVPGEGDPAARLVFVGEAPGRDEDLQGRPFVGAAGQLLTRMIEAMGLRRESVYICNVLKDRPPDNRAPLPEEVESCAPFLIAQLEAIRPRAICALGAVAARSLLGGPVSIVEVRGRRYDFHGIPVIPTFHPAYLLRNPSAKRLAWEDLKKVKKLLSE